MMGTATRTKDSVAARVGEWVERLNEGERTRRAIVNDKHLAEYGRALYPEGGQYATFALDRPGRKFTRVVMVVSGARSVHAFVDPRTGDVYKAAGWSRPAPGVRFNLLDDASRADMYARLSFTGGYLYR